MGNRCCTDWVDMILCRDDFREPEAPNCPVEVGWVQLDRRFWMPLSFTEDADSWCPMEDV